MKTRKRIRASFSEADNVVNVDLPKCWEDLDQEELEVVYYLIAMYEETKEDVRFHIFRELAGLDVIKKDYTGEKFVCFVKVKREDEKPKYIPIKLSANMIAGWMDELNWITDPGKVPVRLEYLGEAQAVDANFHGVDFRTYYMVENYYQGYIQSQNPLAIIMLEKLLYPESEEKGMPGTFRILNIVNWITQVKSVFAQSFPHFFRPVGRSAEGEPEAPNMLDVMNNQIRALTGGDVTKEETINNIDCWRALTELDFKAKEAEELRRQQAKYKK